MCMCVKSFCVSFFLSLCSVVHYARDGSCRLQNEKRPGNEATCMYVQCIINVRVHVLIHVHVHVHVHVHCTCVPICTLFTGLNLYPLSHQGSSAIINTNSCIHVSHADLKAGHVLTCMYNNYYTCISSMIIFLWRFLLSKPGGSWIYFSKPLRLLCVCV